MVQKYNSSWTFTKADVDELLDYCDQQGLGLLRHALSGMVAVGADEYQSKFRRVQLYTNLKNVLTSFEYFLKHLGGAANFNVDGKTLHPIIGEMMSKADWFSLFDGVTCIQEHVGVFGQA